MTTTVAPSSADRITAVYAAQRALYGPTVIAEASSLLEDLLATAERHGYARGGEGLGWLATSAAETATAGPTRTGPWANWPYCAAPCGRPSVTRG
ncbi:hypothetical protein [Streptomyces sp. NPDC046978]|uniref:hypothetical protein n=1 Tax=Streptomyces sp. NPDC046978 TaxID=3154704 RepID=UPI00340023AA